MSSSEHPRGAGQRTLAQLEQQVLGGKWAAGGRLPSERALAAALGASRSTVREAVQNLVARGLLETRQGSGIFVREPTLPGQAAARRQALIDHPLMRANMLEFRQVFECGTARLAAERADAGQRAALGEVIERMREAVACHDVDAEARADAQFHELLAEASHNLMLRHFYASVISSLRQHITRNTYDASRREDEAARQRRLARLRQHERIYASIAARRPDEAFAAMHEHILFVGSQFVDG